MPPLLTLFTDCQRAIKNSWSLYHTRPRQTKQHVIWPTTGLIFSWPCVKPQEENSSILLVLVRPTIRPIYYYVLMHHGIYVVWTKSVQQYRKWCPAKARKWKQERGSNDDKTNISDNEHSTDEGDGKSTYNLNIWPAMGVASSMALPPPGIVDCS